MPLSPLNPKYKERFERLYRHESPPESSSTVHCLPGPDTSALTQKPLSRPRLVAHTHIHAFTFIALEGLTPKKLHTFWTPDRHSQALTSTGTQTDRHRHTRTQNRQAHTETDRHWDTIWSNKKTREANIQTKKKARGKTLLKKGATTAQNNQK